MLSTASLSVLYYEHSHPAGPTVTLSNAVSGEGGGADLPMKKKVIEKPYFGSAIISCSCIKE